MMFVFPLSFQSVGYLFMLLERRDIGAAWYEGKNVGLDIRKSTSGWVLSLIHECFGPMTSY